jgi:hypothetical protein
MTRRQKIWFTVAALFTLMNAAGVGYAVMMEEALHTALHVALIPVGAYWMWAIVRRSRRRDLARSQPVDARIEYLQQSVDAIALEVERIGEAQRFSDRLRAEQAEISLPKQDQQPT